MARLAWLLLGTLLPIEPLRAQARPAPAPSDGDWRMAGRDYAATRFSPLRQITTANVATLRAVWSFSTGLLNAHEGSPLVVGGVMYVHTPFPNALFALDLTKPGAPLLWRWTVPAAVGRLTPPGGCCDVGSRGFAYHPSGKLFVPLMHGELAALDATTGRQIWRVKNVDYKAGGSMPAAPLVVDDLVVVGTGGAEYGFRGHLTAYEAATGRLAWRAYHTGPDAEVLLEGDANAQYSSHRGSDLGVHTWPGDEWKRGGSTASGWLSYDPELGLIYYGTDHPGAYNASIRSGDNKWSNTLFAREARTGKVRWAYQITPHDEWGFDASNENVLVDLSLGGAPVKALVHFDRNGFAYTIDRVSGKVLLAERYGPANWATRIDLSTGLPVREPGFATRPGTKTPGVCPATAGMKGLAPAAFSPDEARFFVPLNNLCMDFEPTPVSYVPGRGYIGATIQMKAGPPGNRGRFIAWDAATGSIPWQIQEPYAVTGGALATAGGLVFYGTMEGWFKAVDQKTGQELWRFKTPSGIMGNPITFQGPDGRQYVAVLSGMGGWFGQGGNGAFPEIATITNRGGTLTVFGL